MYLSIRQRRLIGTLTLGGGAVGAVMTLQQAGAGQIGGIGWVFAALFFTAFASGIFIGVAILEANERGRTMAIPFWAAQVPVLHTGVVSYTFATGAYADITVAGNVTVNFNGMVGSQFQFLIGNPEPFQVGINVLAVFVLYQLLTARQSQEMARIQAQLKANRLVDSPPKSEPGNGPE